MVSPDPRDASFTGNVFRANFKDVIAKRSDLTRIDGGRLVPAASGQTQDIYAGTVLGVVTATGPNQGRLKVYAAGNSDGSQVPVGILQQTTSVDEFSNGTEVAVIKGATLFKDLLIGLDSAAITALNGKVSVEHGVNLIHISA